MVEGYTAANPYTFDPASGLTSFTRAEKKAEDVNSPSYAVCFTSLIEQEMSKIPRSATVQSADPEDYPQVSEEDARKIDETAKQMESLILYQLLKQMWDTIPEGTLFAAGPAEKMFREMWIEQLAGTAVSQGNVLGIAQMVERELLEQANRTVAAEDMMPGLAQLKQDMRKDQARNANAYGYLAGSTPGLD